MRSTVQEALVNDSPPLETDEFFVSLSNTLALKIYANTKPYNLKIANLQKGLIFVCEGEEKVGEGTGFGFPVLITPRETYFSSSSAVFVTQNAELMRIRKDFCMDTVSRNGFGNINLENRKARAFIRYLSKIYQRNRHFRFLSLKRILLKMGIKSTFVRIKPIGKISVIYDIKDKLVNVKVDCRHVKMLRAQKVFVLNEQSASFFRKYSDAHSLILADKQIGAWDVVGSEWACLTDLQGKVGYRLWNSRGNVLRRGREIMKDRLDWVGLDYEIDPKMEVFRYKIEILGCV
jgi:hypothetical protein